MLSRAGIVTVSVVLWSAAVAAQPKPTVPALVGATEVQKLTTPTGFIDDAIAFDDTRFAYVVADGSAKTELHVVGPPAAAKPAPAMPTTQASAAATPPAASPTDTVVDLSAITLHPLTLKLLGPRVFVTGVDANNAQIAALVELATGKPVYKLGPATHITVIARDGKARVAVHRVTGTRHEVELDAIENGKRIAAGHAFELDATDTNKALDLHVNHWSDGWTKAYGIKGGEWDRKENQRTPDVEATYDLIAGKVTDSHPIGDLFEQRKRFQALEQAKTDANLDFVRMSWDNANIVAWRGGKAQNLELDQALGQYDPKSLQGVLEADGTTWILLKVDPVNPDAVARKKADPEYVDVFKAGSDGKAVRKARVLAKGTTLRLGVMNKSGTAEGGAKVNDKIWLLERSPGFDRGGKALTIYSIN
ncbi:MAG TPA: hypothetical protein VFQ65_26505 [Kofleriaceae bacterium]|nr:hypothetical protein [Kofleriaceae bacterium]